MLTILLHSSKTMRPVADRPLPYQRPQLLDQAQELVQHVQSMSPVNISKTMHVTPLLADSTKQLMDAWTPRSDGSRPAIDAFLGDIYSGLQVQSLTAIDRTYANDHLVILSGLYGALKALDSIHPYRMEMGYKLTSPYESLYEFWGNRIARALPDTTLIINVSAIEYTKAVLPYVPTMPVITPKFLTINQKTKRPTFVTVHTKIARGAFAHWLITHKISDPADLSNFNELNYVFDPVLSTPDQPVFVCSSFGGIGLSVRLT